MAIKDLINLIRSDLYRYNGKVDTKTFFRSYLRYPGFRYTLLLRLCFYLRYKKLFFPFYIISRFLYEHYTFKYGISIPFNTNIGFGLYIGHFGGIVVNWESTIGNNCNISHGVTIGKTNRGSRAGCPIIGNNVYIGPGAKLIGKIIIGDNVAIGANCVVVNDIPSNAVVVGIPGQVKSMNGSSGYVNNVWS